MMVKMKDPEKVTPPNDRRFFARFKQKTKNAIPQNVTIKRKYRRFVTSDTGKRLPEKTLNEDFKRVPDL